MSSQEVIDLDDQVLDFVQGKRREMVDKLTEQGVPTDKDGGYLLLSALKDMSTTALGKKRIKTDEKIGANQAAAAGLIAQVLSKTRTLKPYEVDGGVADRVAPELGGDLPTPELIPGEMDTNPPQLSYDTFMANQPIHALEDE